MYTIMYNLVKRRLHTLIKNVAFNNTSILFVQANTLWKSVTFTNIPYTNTESGEADSTRT